MILLQGLHQEVEQGGLVVSAQKTNFGHTHAFKLAGRIYIRLCGKGGSDTK